MRRTGPTLGALLVAIALAGCGGGSSAKGARASSTTTTTTASTTTTVHSTTAAPPQFDGGGGRCIRATPAALQVYLGLTLAAAQARAASEHKTVRVVGTDGTCALVTMEYSASRVDVELAHGDVIAAEIG